MTTTAHQQTAVRQPSNHPVVSPLLTSTAARLTQSPAAPAFPGRVRSVDELAPDGEAAGADWREDILLLDGGATPGPVPSTIVTLAGEHARAPRILRQGVLALADLERVAGVALSEGTAEAARGRTGVGA